MKVSVSSQNEVKIHLKMSENIWNYRFVSGYTGPRST